MSSRVENALKEYKTKYFNQIGKFDLSMTDAHGLIEGDKYDIVTNSFRMGFIVGIRYANKMKKPLNKA